MTLFRRLALLATTLTVVQIASGALVRATGSGDGCPDWPRCFGRWFPPLEYHAVIEWSHRFIGQFAIWSVVALAVVGWRKMRNERRLRIGALVATAGIFLQAMLGAIVVWSKGENAKLADMGPEFVTFHIATATLLVGLLVHLAVSSRADRPLARPPDPVVRRWGIAALATTFAQILIGAYVRGSGAALAYPDFPLMNGGFVPELSGPGLVNFVHRATAVGVGVVVAIFVAHVMRRARGDRALVAFAHAAAAVYLAQVVVGGAQIWTELAWWPVTLHVLGAALLFSALMAAVTLCGSGARAKQSADPVGDTAPPRVGDRIKAYVALTKPRIIMLLLVTTVPTMMLAARGWPGAWLVVATMTGGTLAAGAANAINCYFDRDIDAVMRRTRSRPLPKHQVDPVPALIFAVVLAVGSFAFMALTVNVLAAALTQSAVLFYVFVYTLGLKRSTPQNIVIGGAAGAVPVLVGWAAVTGTVGAPAFVLFLVIFLWTPPHFWALAVRHAGDYAAAGVPMMPVVAGPRSTYRQILAYTLATVGVTIALYPVGGLGAVYLGAAIALGAWFIRHAVVLLRTGTPRAAMGLFRFSISYLALLFAAVGVDSFIVKAS